MAPCSVIKQVDDRATRRATMTINVTRGIGASWHAADCDRYGEVNLSQFVTA